MENEKERALKFLGYWFILHFLLDVLFALPLMIAPAWFLSLLGWKTIDPYTARIAAAALFGIGIESLLGHKGTIGSFKSMLNLKIIWSVTAVAGIIASLVQNVQGRPVFAYAILGVFVAFNVLWVYWRIRINKIK